MGDPHRRRRRERFLQMRFRARQIALFHGESAQVVVGHE